MSSRFLIYALSDPRTGDVRYVGKTEWEGNRRFNHHMYRARWMVDGKPKFRQHVYCWIRSLGGLAPVMEVVEECGDHTSLVEAEQFWIEQFRAMGFRLTNHTVGGEGAFGYRHTDDAKRRMSEAKVGRTTSRLGVPVKVSREDVAAMVSEYGRGVDAGTLGKRYEVSPTVVLKWLRRSGVQTRNAAQQRWVSEKMKFETGVA